MAVVPSVQIDPKNIVPQIPVTPQPTAGWFDNGAPYGVAFSTSDAETLFTTNWRINMVYCIDVLRNKVHVAGNVAAAAQFYKGSKR